MPESTPRERILASAIELLDTEGASSLTVRNVATGANCSTTGVYTHFGGKDGLVDAIFIDGFESFDATLDSAGEDLVDLSLAYRQWALSRRTHYQVMFGSAVPGYRPSVEALDRAGSSFDRLVERIELCTGVGSDEGGRDLAFHVWAVVHGYVMLEMLDMSPPSLGTAEELYRNGLNLMIDGLPQPRRR